MSNFIFDSDHPIDKIVYMAKGYVTTDEYGSGSATLSHSVGTQIYVQGVWSPSAQFALCYPFGMTIPNGQSASLTSTLDATTSDVKIFITGTPKSHAYYRIWGFVDEEATKSLEIPPTATLSSNRFIINSDFSYPKLIKEGKASANSTVTLGQTKMPFVDIWVNKNSQSGRWQLLNTDTFGQDSSLSPLVQITPEKITFNNDPYDNVLGFYYRAYLS
jgi:hypothetical protein